MKNLFRFLFLLAALTGVNGFGQVVNSCNGQPCSPIATSGGTLTIANIYGGMNANFEEIITGSPATSTVLIQGCMRGNTCETVDSNATNVAAVNRAIVSTAKPFSSFVVTFTFTGGTNPTLQVNPLISVSGISGGSVPQSGNLTQIAGNAVVTAASGIQKVGISGATGATVDAAPGAAIPTNAIAMGCKGQVSGANSGFGTGGNTFNCLTDVSGQLFVIPGGSFKTSAFQTLSTNTTTQIAAAPGAGIFTFVTSLIINTRVAATGTSIVKLVFGTGSNCGTGTTDLTPGFPNTAIGIFAPPLGTPLVPTSSAQAICATQSGGTAGTTDVLLTAYLTK